MNILLLASSPRPLGALGLHSLCTGRDESCCIQPGSMNNWVKGTSASGIWGEGKGEPMAAGGRCFGALHLVFSTNMTQTSTVVFWSCHSSTKPHERKVPCMHLSVGSCHCPLLLRLLTSFYPLRHSSESCNITPKPLTYSPTWAPALGTSFVSMSMS